MTDEQLLADYIANGSQDSFAELVKRLGPKLLGMVWKRVRSDSFAQEVMQETWLAVHLHCREFRGGSAVGSWIGRIAINAAISMSRVAKNRLPPVLPRNTDLLGFACDPAHDLFADEEDQATRSIRAAFQQLSDDARRVIEIVDILELKYEVAAQRLSIPIGTVRSRRHRGLLQLRKAFAA